MRVIGFHFTKMSAERLKDSAKEVKIDTDLHFPEIREAKTPLLKTEEQLLEAQFEYVVSYDPGLAKIIVGGKVLMSVNGEEHKEILKQWKKKDLPEDFRIFLVNVVMKKSVLKALNLCDELNLPVHIPLPTLRKNKQ